MKKTSRIIAFLMALVLFTSAFYTAVDARYLEWYDSEGMHEMFQCEDCGDYGEASDANECPDCNETYCDDCFCDNCERCQEHCSCDFRADDYLEMDGELEIPEPESVDVSKAQDLVGRDLASMLPDTAYPEYTYNVNESASEFLSEVCGYSTYDAKTDMRNCVETLRNFSDIREVIHTEDTTNVEEFHSIDLADNENHTAKFIEALSKDAKITAFRAKNFNWNSDKGIYSQAITAGKDAPTISLKQLTSLSNQYFALLKNLAIESGFDKTRIGQIKIDLSNTNALDSAGSAGEWDDTRNTIDLNAYTATDGHDFLKTITHEFIHALNTITAESNQSTPNTIRDVRILVANKNYMSATDEYTTYTAQLEERLPRMGENQLNQEGDTEEGWQYLVKHYGSEILPLIVNAVNQSHGYTRDSQVFLSALMKSAKELEMLSADIDFNAVPAVSVQDVSTVILSSNFQLIRVDAANGRTYIVPTQGLVEMVGSVVESSMKDYLSSISGNIPHPQNDASFYTDIKNYKYIIQEAMQDPNFAYANEGGTTGNNTSSKQVACSDEKMTADDFEFCLSVAALMALDDGFSGNESEKNSYYALMARLLDEAEDLQNQMNSLDSVEDLADDLEMAIDDARYLQDELQSLLDEYDALSDEYESLCEELESELEETGDNLSSDGRNMVEDDTTMGRDEKEAFIDELNQQYEYAKSDYESRLEDMKDELDDLASQISDVSDELEGLLVEIDEIDQDLEKAVADAKELSETQKDLQEDLAELQKYMNQAGASTMISTDFERRVRVKVTDENGTAVAAPVYLKTSEDGVAQLIGRTDTEGVMEATVDTCVNSGLIINVGSSVKGFNDGTSMNYGTATEKDLIFLVEIEDDTPIYVLETEVELKKVTEKKDASSMGTLRVTIRAKVDSVGYLRNYDCWNPYADDYQLKVSWEQYYRFKMTADDYLGEDGIFRVKYWKNKMTEENANYYGAYLLHLSGDGQLPCTDKEVIFSALYRWENGAAVSNLIKSTDFASARSKVDAPCESVAFNFGFVPAGRYQLVIILPDDYNTYHFQEITVHPGFGNFGKNDTKVMAQTWTALTDPTSDPAYSNKTETKSSKKSPKNSNRFYTMNISTDVYSLDGKKIDKLANEGKAVFTLAVDAAGNKLWSVASFNEAGLLTVPVRTGWKDSGWDEGAEGASRNAAVGQIYIYGDTEEDYRLLPLTYTNEYNVYHNQADGSVGGKKYVYTKVGKLYALQYDTAAQKKNCRPTYVAFWEQYFDEDGNIHYKTVDRTVSFELHWDTGERLNLGTQVEDHLHLVDTVSTNEVGVMTNYLTQSKLVEKGASYTFTYVEKNNDICGGEKTLKKIPVYQSAERIYLENGDETWLGILRGLTGTAVMTLTGNDVDGTTEKVTVTVEPQIVETVDGIAIRFIVGDQCVSGVHQWKLVSNTSTCEGEGYDTYRCLHCDAQKEVKAAALGHVHAEGDPYIYMTEQKHGYYCTRCGLLVEGGKHGTNPTVIHNACTEKLIDIKCEDCLWTRRVTVYSGSHDFGDRPQTYYDENYHWQYCTVCGEAVKSAHQMVEENRVKYCKECDYVAPMAFTTPAVYSWVWTNSNVCCPHKNLTAYYILENKAKRYENSNTRKTVWQYMLYEDVVDIATGDVLNTASVKNTLLQTRGKNIYGYVRAVMYWGSYSVESEWIPIIQMTEIEGYYATCYGEGMESYWVCSCGMRCDEARNEVTELTIEMTEHTYDNDCDSVCNVCGLVRQVSHVYGEWQSAEGMHFRSCTKCEKESNRTECEPTEWIIDVEETCTTDGKKHRDCKVCGALLVEEIIPASHDYGDYEEEDSNGNYQTAKQRCNRCGTEETVTGDLPVTHVKTYVESVPPTEKSAGVMAYYICEETGVISLDKEGKLVVASVEDLELTLMDGNCESGKMSTVGLVLLISGIVLSLLIAAVVIVLILVLKKKKQEEKTEKEEQNKTIGQ